MISRLMHLRILAIAIVAAASMGGAATPAAAITADLAKKCQALMIKAYPPVLAGSKHGTAKEERQYYQTCLAKGGQMDSDSAPPPPANDKSK